MLASHVQHQLSPGPRPSASSSRHVVPSVLPSSVPVSLLWSRPVSSVGVSAGGIVFGCEPSCSHSLHPIPRCWNTLRA